MLKWILRNQKILSLGFGFLMLAFALGLFFWKNESSISKEEHLAQANIARMEAHMQNQGNTKAQNKTASLKSFHESRNKQMQYLLITMIIGGIGFIGFGFLKKS